MLSSHSLNAAVSRLESIQSKEYITPTQEKVLALKNTLAGLSNIDLTDVEMEGLYL